MGQKFTLIFNSPMAFEYTNYKGETSVRKAILRTVFFGSTEHHTEDQWLVAGYDVEKTAQRTYALKDMRPVPNTIQQSDPKLKPDIAEYLAKAEYFTIRIQKDPTSARPDLPKQFTWMPTMDQRARALVNHDGQTLEDLDRRGGVTWAELAAILRNVPYSWIAELRAVAACTVLYPQEGFTL